MARLAKLAFDNAVIDGFNTKLDESLSKFDDNIDKMAFLKNMLSTLSDPTQIAEVNRQLEELGGIVYEDLYSAYADDATKFNDELKDMQKHLEWAIENGRGLSAQDSANADYAIKSALNVGFDALQKAAERNQRETERKSNRDLTVIVGILAFVS